MHETEPAPAWWRSKGHGIFYGASRSDGLRRGRKRVAPSLLAPPAGGWQFSGWWHFRVSSRSILVLREPSLDWHHDATPGGAADRCAGAVRVAHCEVTPANRSNCGPWRLMAYGPLDAMLPYVAFQAPGARDLRGVAEGDPPERRIRGVARDSARPVFAAAGSRDDSRVYR